MISLIFLLAVIAWWFGGGLYARRQAIQRNLQAQPSVLNAMLRGPLWVREMLIWSTLPPRSSYVASNSTEEIGERSRAAAIPQPAQDAPAEPEAWSGVENLQEGMEAAEDEVSVRGRPATGRTPVIAMPPLPQNQPRGDLERSQSQPLDLPSPVVPEEFHPAQTLASNIDQPDPPAENPVDLDLPSPVAEQPPTQPPTQPPIQPPVPGSTTPKDLVAPPLPDSNNQSGIPVIPESPKKLPKQPKRSKTVTVLCPQCNTKRKYGKDAVCPECSKPNPWLVEKWGILLDPEPPRTELSMPVQPEQPIETQEPHLIPEPVYTPQIEDVPAPLSAPLEPLTSLAVEEDALVLLPDSAVKPKRLPGKPFFGTTVKAICPWCSIERQYAKDAVCSDCQNQNPWLAEKWKIKSTTTYKSFRSGGTEPSSRQPEAPPVVSQSILPEPVIPEAALESISPTPVVSDIVLPEPALPDLSSVAQENQAPLQPQEESLALDDGVDSHKEALSAPPVGHCPGCSKKAMADLNGDCIFCGHSLGGVS